MISKVSFQWYPLSLKISIAGFPHMVSYEQNCGPSQALSIFAKNFPSIKTSYILLVLRLLLFSRTTCYSSPVHVHLSPLSPPTFRSPSEQAIHPSTTNRLWVIHMHCFWNILNRSICLSTVRYRFFLQKIEYKKKIQCVHFKNFKQASKMKQKLKVTWTRILNIKTLQQIGKTQTKYIDVYFISKKVTLSLPHTRRQLS